MKRVFGFLVLLIVGGCGMPHKDLGPTAEGTLNADTAAAAVPAGFANYSHSVSISLPETWEVQDLKSGDALNAAKAGGDASLRTMMKEQVRNAAADNAEGLVGMGSGSGGGMAACAVFRQPVGSIATLEAAMDDVKKGYANDPTVMAPPASQTLTLPSGKFGFVAVQMKDPTGQPGAMREEFIAFDGKWQYRAVFLGIGGDPDSIARQAMDTFRPIR